MKKLGVGDGIFIFIVMILGLAEVAHFAGVFLGWSVFRCSKLFAAGCILLLVVAVVGGCVYGMKSGMRFGGNSAVKAGIGMKKVDAHWLYGIFALLVIGQIVFVLSGSYVYRNGDMTLETVGSFFVHDGIYRVNPLTGTPYTGGIPLRLEILGLPTLYSMLCLLTGMEPTLLVVKVVPICVMLLSYLAFAVLGKALFGEKHKERALFLIFVVFLMWGGAYMYGMDGFNLLYAGFRGVTIRNLVLIPWLFSLCLRKKYWVMVFCFLAEICLVWTMYGLGVCVTVVLLMFVASKIEKRLEQKTVCGGEEDAT